MCVAWLAALTLPARTAPASPQPVAVAIEQLFANAFPANAPGAAVLVTHHGEIVVRRAFGSANLELGVALQPEHVFRLGSITKQFTAIAILQLVEAGKVKLEDTITTYVPGVQTHGQVITLAHLLTHTSGLPSYTDQPAWRADSREDMTLEKILEYIKDVPLHFFPGTDWAYCNTGYRLLGAVIEKVSGVSYADYVQEHLFKPSGMQHSAYDDARRVTPSRVAGYSSGREGVVNAAFVSMTQPHAAGALSANVDDLWRWQQALLAGKLVSPALLAQAQTAARLSDGRDAGYGFGWTISFTAGHRSIEHGGGIQGFSTYMLYLPEAEVFAAVLCNSDQPARSPARLCTAIAELVLGPNGKPAPVIVPAATLASYAGVYRAPHEKIEFAIAAGEFVVRDQRDRTFPLVALAEAEFFAPQIQMRYTFRDDPANPGRRRVSLKPRAGAEQYATPIGEPLHAPPASVPPETLARYAGEYELRPNFVLSVKHTGEGLTAQATGQRVTDLAAESETRFRVKQVPAMIEFTVDDTGAVSGLILRQGGRATRGKRLP